MNNDDLFIDVNSESDTVTQEDEEVVYTTPKKEESNVVTDTKPEKEEVPPKKKALLSIFDLVSVVMSSFVIIAIIFVFMCRLVGVDGQSMTNTLQHGDWLLTVNKTEYVNGDIVVITQDTWFNAPLIKRVIATGGQVIDIDEETDTVTVDGKVLDEPYIREDFINDAGIHDYPFTVPEGHLFCMGDNRNGSTDSRFAEVGVIDEREILGKAVVRILPFGDFDIYDYE
ncbi:MAG: signal peptidase I [Ruminococcaceae bacterium]|nr:signal peptidase I [Oscillospiraceae bacterium]